MRWTRRVVPNYKYGRNKPESEFLTVQAEYSESCERLGSCLVTERSMMKSSMLFHVFECGPLHLMSTSRPPHIHLTSTWRSPDIDLTSTSRPPDVHLTSTTSSVPRSSPLKAILYSGKLSREKTFANWWKRQFSWRKLSRNACCAAPKDTTPPNFAEKNFVNSHKTAKFAKVFSLESFPLYDILNTNQRTKVRSPRNEPMYFVQQDKITSPWILWISCCSPTNIIKLPV